MNTWMRWYAVAPADTTVVPLWPIAPEVVYLLASIVKQEKISLCTFRNYAGINDAVRSIRWGWGDKVRGKLGRLICI